MNTELEKNTTIRNIIDANLLSPIDKCVLIVLINDSKDGISDIKQSDIRASLNTSITTIRKSLQNLKAKRYIDITKTNRKDCNLKKNAYKILTNN